MQKPSTLWTFITVAAGLCATLPFASEDSASVEATAAIPVELPILSRKREPLADVQTGIIANPQEMTLGMIKDWVFDLSVGRIIYVVGALDHLGEFNDKLFVIPWEAVKVDPETNTFLLIGDALVLENAPSLALDAWPNLPTSQWSAAVDAYWQERLGPKFAAVHDPAALSTASALLGMTIKNSAGQDVGPIKELAFDPQRGLITYIVLSCEEIDARNRLVFFAIPWRGVKVNLAQHTFTADVDKKMPAECRDVLYEYVGGNSPTKPESLTFVHFTPYFFRTVILSGAKNLSLRLFTAS